MANNSANYNVNMRFTADTGQAKQQLRDLQSSLDTLMNQIATKNIKFFDVNATKKEIDEASAAVQELKIALDQATNVNTGRLDLSKFSKSLSQSGYTLQDFATHLENLGPTGDKAFVALAQSVINAEVPLKRTNAILDNFKKTLANTAKWQISSNLMHGVQGSLQKAYYYAEDLNRSLNDIRIVTGQSNDQMAQFAEKANKAAQALSTTTTNYTNASLIYYQQGLSDKEVADRTEVTIKMANAAGESASKVSDQLTAVWNNFYDGSKSLEYYADVMTKLGAYTASSTDEISEGIQKFASVANTIGLSYEYATSALATLTAKTRESANTVGNSLKTLFARIQGLTLGETLEDGTDLNKYSKALEKVGISIKDQQGELKDMNTILDEMMNKWDSLSRAEQVALAQTVGGVRQYTQLVNLMENKDYFKELVGVAKNSEGTLQEQADIYAESWEASKKRVQASLEEIYKQLVDDKFFIGLNDTLSDTLNITSKLIDSLGGLPGVLSVVSTLMLKSFGPDIVNNMQRMASNLFIDSGAAQNQATVMKQQIIKQLQGWNETEGSLPIEWQASTTFQNSTLVEAATQSYDLQIATERLNETDKQRLLVLKQISDKYAEIAYNARVSLEQANENAVNARRNGLNQIRALEGDSGGADGVAMASGEIDSAAFLRDEYVDFMNSNIDDSSDQELINKIGYLNLMGDSYDNLNKHIDQYSKATDDIKRKAIGQYIRNDLKELQHQYGQTGTTLQMLNQFTDNYIDVQEEQGIISREQAIIMKRVTAALNQVTIARTEDEHSVKQYKNAVELFNSELSKSSGAVMTFSQGLVSGAQGISQFAIGINSIHGAIQALNNEDLTFGEKVLQMTTSISIAIPSIINGFTNLQKSIQSINNSKGLIGTNILQLVTGLNEIKGDNLRTALDELNVTSKTTGLRFKALSAMSDAYKTSMDSAQIGVNGLTKAMAEQAAGTAALKAGIKAVAGSLGVYIAVAAAIAAVIAVIVHLNEVAKTKTLESQLARSEEAAANFEKQLEKTKSKAEELKNVFNDYKNVKKSLDECTIGTEEWRKKLQETNETALEILKNYPELKNIEGAWGKKDTGEIWVDESALKGLQSQYDNKVLSQSYNLARQNQNSNELKNAIAQKSSFGDITSFYASDIGTLEGPYRPEKNEKTFDALDYIKNNFQNYKGYSDDLILKDIYSYLNKEGYSNIENQAYQERLTQFINEINPIVQSLISTIEENTDATLQAEQESVIQQKLGKTNMSSQEVKLTTEAYNNAIEDKISEMKKATSADGKWNGTITYEGLEIGTHGENARNKQQVRDLWDTYLKSQDIDINDTDYRLNQENSVKGKGQDRYFIYGEDQKVSFEEVIQAVAQYEIDQGNFLTELNQTATNFLTNLGKIQYTDETKQKIESGGTLGKGLSSFIGNKDLTELTQEEIDNLGELTEDTLKERVATAMGFNLAEATEEQLAKLDDQLIAIYGAVGVDSGEEFVNQFNTAIINYGKETEKIANSFYGKWATAENLNSFTLEVQKKLKSTFVDVFRVSGEEGIAVFKEIISKYGSDLTPELLDLIGDFDWTQSGAIDNFISALEDLGILTNDNTEAWKKFSNQMVEAANNLPIDKLTNLRDILEDIYKLLGKDVGSIFSQDDIDKLVLGGYDIEGHYAQVGSDEYIKTRDYTTEEKNKAYEQQIQTAEKKNEIIYGASDYNQNQVQSKVDSWQKYGDKYISGEWDNLSTSYVKSYIDSIGGIENAATITEWDQDNFSDEYLNGISSQKRAEIVDAIVTGIESVYNGQTDTGVITASHLYNSSDSINEMTQMEGFRDENGSVSDSGIEAISGKLAGSEEGLELLHKYQDEIKNVAKGTKEWDEITNQFIKDSQGLEYKEQAKELGNYNDKLKEAKEAGKDYEEELGNVRKQLNKMLDINVDDDFIEKYQDQIDKMLSGKTLEERQSAANTIKFQAELDKEDIESKIPDELQNEIMPMLQNNLPKLELDAEGKIVMTGDSGQAVAAIGQVIAALQAAGVPAESIAEILRSVLGTDITISGDGIEQFAELAKALTSGDLEAIAKWSETYNDGKDLLNLSGSGRTANVTPNYAYENGGSKGGGGGGGKSTKSANDIGKEIQDELLKTKEKKRDRLETLREGANPEDSAKYIQEEIKLLKEEQDILEDQIKSWKKLLKLKVEEFNKENPEFEIKLTDDGEIANASELWGKVWAQYQKNLEDGMSEEDLNEWFTKIKDSLDGPMGIQQNIDENVALIAQKEKEAAELELEAITKAIDWKVKQIDFQIKRLNYYQEKLLKQAHGNKQTIEAMLEGFAYQEQEMLQLFDKGATLRQGIDQLNAAKAKYPGYEQMFDEQILEYQSDLIDVNEAILDLRNDIEDLVQNVLDLALDEIDKQIERLDTYTSMLDHLNNIIDLSGRSMLDMGLKTQIGATKVETMLGKMKSLKAQMDGLAKATKEAQAALADRQADGDTSSVKFWENQVEVLKQETEKASDEFLASWEETLEAAQDLFEMRVEMAVNVLSNALSPFETLEDFQDKYEKAKTINEEYLDDAERLYELNKLNRQLNLQLADTNDLLAKQKLRDIQQEIHDLQADGVQMSQYDLEYLQKKYDLQLAEIALMEQQNSKTSMRLVRDAAGNWTYAYDADEEKIEDATQKYEDAVHELGKLSKDYINDVSEQLIQNQIDFKEALQDLDKNSADYSNQLLSLQEYYVERQRYLLDELNKGVVNSGLTFHDTLYGQMTDLYDYNDAYMLFVNNSNTTISELQTNYKDWQKVVEAAMNVAGTSWENFGSDMGGTLDSLEEHIQKLCDEIEELVNVLMGYISQSIGMVLDWEQKYSKRTDEELAKNEQYIDGNFGSSGGGSGARNLVGVDLSAIAIRMKNGESTVVDKNGNVWTSIDDVVTARNEKLDNMRNEGQELKNDSSTDYWTKDEMKQITSEKDEKWLDDILNGNGAASGAYTGNWAKGQGFGLDNGKIIKVHPKELILNQKDTSNILRAVDIVRNMNDWVDKQVQSMINFGQIKLGNLIDKTTPPVYETQPIKQEVTIQADFPGVTDHYEIEEALSNLSNNAAQYISANKSK